MKSIVLVWSFLFALSAANAEEISCGEILKRSQESGRITLFEGDQALKIEILASLAFRSIMHQGKVHSEIPETVKQLNEDPKSIVGLEKAWQTDAAWGRNTLITTLIDEMIKVLFRVPARSEYNYENIRTHLIQMSENKGALFYFLQENFPAIAYNANQMGKSVSLKEMIRQYQNRPGYRSVVNPSTVAAMAFGASVDVDIWFAAPILAGLTYGVLTAWDVHRYHNEEGRKRPVFVKGWYDDSLGANVREKYTR